MNGNEVVLIVLLKNYKTKRQRTLILQHYVQQYGALSREAGVKVKEILDEVDNG